jgi:hypothetical protein
VEYRYEVLTEDGMTGMHRQRLLELERQNFAALLKLGELDELGVPADDPDRRALEREAAVTAVCMARHRGLLGMDENDTGDPDVLASEHNRGHFEEGTHR